MTRRILAAAVAVGLSIATATVAQAGQVLTPAQDQAHHTGHPPSG